MKQRKLGKRIETWFICLAMVLTTINLPAFTTVAKAEDVEIGGIKYVLNSLGEAVVSSGVNYSGNITIPSSVTYGDIVYPVTYIMPGAFFDCVNLTGITIPNSVTTIGNGAFRGCTKLTSITIPDKVKTLEPEIFENCTSLTSVTIPNSVTTIDSAFKGCTALTSITIPDSVTKLSGTFSGCTKLASITIPNKVTDIDTDTFRNCEVLTSIEIPNSVTRIGISVFSGCTALTSIKIPKSVTSIGTSNFSYGNNIEALVECSTYLKSCVELKNCKKVTWQHHGGTATCKNGKICEGCGTDYTETNPSNHIYTAYLSIDPQMHTKKCVYCDARSDNLADQENHELSDSETISIDETRHGKVCSKCDGFVETGEHDFIVDGTLDASKESCTICNAKNIAYTGLDSKVSVAPLTYTGSSQTPIIAITGLTKDTDYTVDVTEKINVGSSYTATITGIGNYAGIRTVTWSISKSAASVATVPVAKTLYYNGTAQALVSAGSTSDGTIKYSTTENGTYTETIPTGTNVGSYSVWYKVEADGNHTDSVPVKVDVTIAQKSITPTISDITAVTYDGQAKTPEITVKDGATTLVKNTDYTVSYSNNVKAGTATVTVKAVAGSNYTFTDTTKNFTINKVSAPTVADTNVSYYYGASGQKTVELALSDLALGTVSGTPVITDIDDIIGDTVTYGASGVTFTFNANGPGKVGKTATISVTITSENYADFVAKIVITLTRKEDQEAPECALSFTRNADDTITAKIATVAGAEYSFDGINWSASNTKTVAPNTVVKAYIRLKETETKNSSPVASDEKTSPKLIVKTPNISPTGGKFTSTQTVTITTGTEGAVIHYTTDGSTPTEASLVYTQALSLSVTTTVKAIAIKEGMENSAIASVTFTKQSSGGTGTGGTSDSGTGAGTTTDKPDDKKDTDVTDKTEDKKDTDVADKTESTTDTKTETKEDGTVVKTEADGSKTETLKVESADGKTISTVEVKTDANGNVTDSTVTVETEVTGKKLIVDVATIKEMIAKNEVISQANTTVVLTANDDKGNEKYNVEVDAKDIVSKKLVVYALDKNGKVVIVDRTKNTVKVDEAGNISMKIEGTGDYKLLNSKDAKAADKEILKTVEPAKKSEKVKKGEKTEFKLSKKLNKDNIAKITYESNNKNVKVDKKGKITAKMAGKATVTAEVTLQNGKTKKIKMKVKVN